MNQIQIGRFIADCRKESNMTQRQIAEKLGITNRAVSKWETGKSMPDASLMLELCEALHISVNAVSYTHLDVYKRQDWNSPNRPYIRRETRK